MGLLGLFSVCKGQENTEQPATMGAMGSGTFAPFFHFFS